MSKLQYCARCKKATTHRVLPKAGLFTQFLIACIGRFSVDLREPDVECLHCGSQS